MTDIIQPVNGTKRKTKDTRLDDASPSVEIVRILFKFGLSAIKSFIFALSQIVWIFAGIFIIGATFLYLIKSGDAKTLTEIPKGLGYLLDFFKNYWGWFFLGIWIFDLIINFRDINKD